VHASVTTWRIDEAIREGDAYERFLREAAPRVVPLLRRHGLVAAWAVRTGADTAVTVNVYPSAEAAEAALAEAGEVLRRALAGRLEPVERRTGLADDLAALADALEPDG
jgi:hypothetical protein